MDGSPSPRQEEGLWVLGREGPGLWSWLSAPLNPCSRCCVPPLGCMTPGLVSLSPMWAGPGHFSLGHVPVRDPPWAADPLGRAGAAACPLLPALALRQHPLSPAPQRACSLASLSTPCTGQEGSGDLSWGPPPLPKRWQCPVSGWPGAASPQSPQRRGGVYSFLWGPLCLRLNNFPSGLKS